MEFMPSLRAAKQNHSPLEGHPAFRAQHAEAGLRQLGRQEWWLWFSAFFVTTLSATVFALTAFSSFFRHQVHFYEIRPDQARWGVLSLLLVFNGWLVSRQWFFRRERRHLTRAGAEAETHLHQITPPTPPHPPTDSFTHTY